MNWDTGSWRNPKLTQRGKHRRITVTGDWAPVRHYEEVILQNPEGVYGDLLPALRNSSLNIVNLESVLGMHGEPILKNGPNLRGDERAVESLTAAPFQVACLANNHTYDYGSEGLEHTLKILEDHGIRTVGAGLTGDEAAKPLVVDVDGLALGIINYAEGDECRSIDGGPGANGLDGHLVEQVKALKKDADTVIIVFHGGREFTPVPPPYVVKELRKAAAAGASAVIAHHPHVPQGIEITDENVPIAYSLGNFVFWQNTTLHYRKIGYLIHLDFEDSQLTGIELTPYNIQPEGLALMKDEEKEAFFQEMKQISEWILDSQTVRDVWNAFIDYHQEKKIAKRLENAAQLISGSKEERDNGIRILFNAFFTPAHYEFHIDAFRRMGDGTFGKSPEWAPRLVYKWMNRQYI